MDESIIRNKYRKKNARLTKKIGGLLILMSFTAIVLIVESYAWFVGTSSVTTNSFEINVSTAQNLMLSLDGSNWADSLTLSQENILGTGTGTASASKAYSGNTNHWVGTSGLIPVSTDGAVDSTVSRLKLYEKFSLTATAGGFRLLANRVDNYSSASGGGVVPEKDGYVAFDLFIKNGTAGYYVSEYNAADNEAVYLTTNSGVTATPSGANADDYGLANSVRIAFVQIARVAASTADASTITSMNCSAGGSGSSATSLCSSVTPTIYEPNDKSHHATLISYFNSVCKKKTVSGQTITYGEACTALAANTAVTTYVVKDAIASTDNVDIYDGLNDYTVPNDYKLVASNSFTDTMKNLTDVNRPAFLMLAPNSITKVRVYIYLEGQDVDNYDLISLGEKISVRFGFTKDQRNLSSLAS